MLRLTRKQSREVDRIAIEEYGIPSIVLMENAARSAVDGMADLLPPGKAVLVEVGPGNNGGDGLAVARHLANRGVHVVIDMTARDEAFKGDAAVNLRIARAMGLRFNFTSAGAHRSYEQIGSEIGLVVDALFGTGLNRQPDERMTPLIEGINARVAATRTPLVSLDLPSGLDCDTGRSLGACFRATRTVTFAAEKVGFAELSSTAFTGVVVVADIGVPRAAVEKAARLAD